MLPVISMFSSLPAQLLLWQNARKQKCTACNFSLISNWPVSCRLLRRFFCRFYFFVSLLLMFPNWIRCAHTFCVLELTIIHANCIRESSSMFKIGKNLLHFVCGFHLVWTQADVLNKNRLQAHKHTRHSETHMWHMVEPISAHIHTHTHTRERESSWTFTSCTSILPHNRSTVHGNRHKKKPNRSQ